MDTITQKSEISCLLLCFLWENAKVKAFSKVLRNSLYYTDLHDFHESPSLMITKLPFNIYLIFSNVMTISNKPKWQWQQKRKKQKTESNFTPSDTQEGLNEFLWTVGTYWCTLWELVCSHQLNIHVTTLRLSSGLDEPLQHLHNKADWASLSCHLYPLWHKLHPSITLIQRHR